MKKTTNLIRRIIALSVGLPVTVAGLVLIPLPGPGVLLTLIGLWILSFGFDSVKRPLDTFKQKLIAIYRQAYQRYDHFLDKHNLKD